MLLESPHKNHHMWMNTCILSVEMESVIMMKIIIHAHKIAINHLMNQAVHQAIVEMAHASLKKERNVIGVRKIVETAVEMEFVIMMRTAAHAPRIAENKKQ